MSKQTLIIVVVVLLLLAAGWYYFAQNNAVTEPVVDETAGAAVIGTEGAVEAEVVEDGAAVEEAL